MHYGNALTAYQIPATRDLFVYKDSLDSIAVAGTAGTQSVWKIIL